jgi:hypothetical protein
LLTADLAAAEAWYTKLLGRGPDYRPMDTLVQWELFDQGGLMLSTSDEIAGKGVLFLYVDAVATERRRLQGLGIVLGDDAALAALSAGMTRASRNAPTFARRSGACAGDFRRSC